MRQDDYDVIMSYQYGAPALAPKLAQSFNNVVEKANQLTELKRLETERARKELATKDMAARTKNRKHRRRSNMAHALLAPSGSERWLNCTPSAYLESRAYEGHLAPTLKKAQKLIP